MFDLIVVLILAVSALVGFVRGAAREVVTVIAFLVSIAVTVLALRFTGPLGRQAIDPDWLGTGLALIVVFLAVYIALRVIGGRMTDHISKTKHLGTLDRSVGLGFGLIRALVVLGVFNIVFHLATPPERTPQWVTEAKLYPLTDVSARALRALAPKGSAIASKVAPALKNAVAEGAAPGDNAADPSYDAADRKAMNDLLEKSR